MKINIPDLNFNPCNNLSCETEQQSDVRREGQEPEFNPKVSE